MLTHVESEVEFENFLLGVGSNTQATKTDDPFFGCIAPPQDLMEQGELPELIFPDSLSQEDLASWVILTPRIDESLKVNDLVLDRHHGEAHVYYSADVAECADDPDEAVNYSQKLHGMTPTGLPPCMLTWKVDGQLEIDWMDCQPAPDEVFLNEKGKSV